MKNYSKLLLYKLEQDTGGWGGGRALKGISSHEVLRGRDATATNTHTHTSKKHTHTHTHRDARQQRRS